MRILPIMFSSLLLSVSAARAQQPDFTIDAATLAEQVPPSTQGAPLPLCESDTKPKACAVAHSLVSMIDPKAIAQYADPERLKRLTKMINSTPGNAAPLLQRSQMYIGAKQFASALADLNQLIKLSPSSPSALVMRAQIYVLARQYALAERDIAAIKYWTIARTGGAPNTLQGYADAIQADIFVRRGELPQARASLEQANATYRSDLSVKVQADYESALAGFSPDQMRIMKWFLTDGAFDHKQNCEKPDWLDQAMASDMFAMLSLNYLADLPEKCQSNTISLGFANRAVKLHQQKASAGTFVAMGFNDDIGEALRVRAVVEERLGQSSAALRDYYDSYLRYKATYEANHNSVDWRETLETAIERVAAKLPTDEVATLGIEIRSTAQRNVESYNSRLASYNRQISEKIRDVQTCVDRWNAVTDRVKTFGEELHPELIAKECDGSYRDLIGLLQSSVGNDEFMLSSGTVPADDIAAVQENMATHRADLERQMQQTFPWN